MEERCDNWTEMQGLSGGLCNIIPNQTLASENYQISEKKQTAKPLESFLSTFHVTLTVQKSIPLERCFLFAPFF